MSTLYPKGYYRGRGIPSTYDMGSNKDGDAEVGLTFEFTSGEHVGGRLNWKGGFGEEAVTSNGKSKNDITFDSLRAAGMTNDDLDAPVGIGETEADLVVDHYTFNDEKTGAPKTIAQIKWVNAPSGPKFKNKMDAAKRKSFAAQMKAKLIVHRQKNGARAAASPMNGDPRGSVVAPIGDEDIPF